MSTNKFEENHNNIETTSTNFIMNSIQQLENDVNDLRKQNSSSHERCFDRLNNLEKSEIIIREQYKTVIKQLDDFATAQSNIRISMSDMTTINHKLDSVMNDYEAMHKDFREIRDMSHKIDTIKKDHTDLEKEIESLEKELKELTSHPAKKWEMTSNQIWTLVVAAIFAIVARNLGLI